MSVASSQSETPVSVEQDVTLSPLMRLLKYGDADKALPAAFRTGFFEITVVPSRAEGYDLSIGGQIWPQRIPEEIVSAVADDLAQRNGFPLLDDTIVVSQRPHIASVTPARRRNETFRIYFQESLVVTPAPQVAEKDAPQETRPAAVAVETPVEEVQAEAASPVDLETLAVNLVVDAHGADEHRLTLHCPTDGDAEITVGAEVEEQKISADLVPGILAELRSICGMEANGFGRATSAVIHRNSEQFGGSAKYSFQCDFLDLEDSVSVEIFVISVT